MSNLDLTGEIKISHSCKLLKIYATMYYAEKYRGRGKAIVLMGVNFNKEQRNIEEGKAHAE